MEGILSLQDYKSMETELLNFTLHILKNVYVSYLKVYEVKAGETRGNAYPELQES